MKRPDRIRIRVAAALLGLTLVCAAPAVAHARAKQKKPQLYLVVDYPYQLWNKAGTKIHLVVYGPKLKPLRGAEAFLGTQGYVWDTQSDMAWALAGALMAIVLLGRYHDAQIGRMPGR